MSVAKKGCLAFLGACVLLGVFLATVQVIGSWAHRTFGPKPTPVPTKTTAEIAGEEKRQRDAAWRKEKLRQVIARQRAEAARQREEEETAWLETRAGKVWKEHRDWDRNDCQVIAKRRVRLGFTEEQCRAAWGAPDDVRRSIEPGHTTTLLCYGDFCQRSLYFVDDRLLRIEQ